MGNTTVLRLDDKNHDPIALSIVFDDCFLVTCIAFLLRPGSDNGTSAQTTSLAFPKSSILSTNSSASGTLNRLIRDRLVASNVCHVFFKNLADETKASRAILFFFDTSYLKVCFLLFFPKTDNMACRGAPPWCRKEVGAFAPFTTRIPSFRCNRFYPLPDMKNDLSFFYLFLYFVYTASLFSSKYESFFFFEKEFRHKNEFI